MTPFSPPSIVTLTDRMLKARVAEPFDAAEAEVEPYEVLNGFRTDPQTAYTDAVVTLCRSSSGNSAPSSMLLWS